MSLIPVDVKMDWKFLVAAGVLVAGYLYYQQHLVKKAAAALNPVDPDNVFASSANAIGEAVTGEEGWTIGGGLWELGHYAETDPNTGQQTIRANPLGAALDWFANVE